MKSVRFSEETRVKSFKEQDPPDRINHPNKRIHWGEDRVQTYDPDEPSNTINKTRSKLYNPLKGKYLVRDPHVSGLLKYVEKFSITGQIWRFVWKKSVVYSSLSSTKFATLRNNFWIEMNLYRKLHGSMPLKLDSYLSNKALEAAKLSAARGKWAFSERKCKGIIFKMIHLSLAPLLVHNWYKESRKYNYGMPGPQLYTTHFTSIIWKSSSKVGIGIAKRGFDLYIYFTFSPPGNVQRQFEQNVCKPRYHFINSRTFFHNLP